jgi:corrinoid protein of di/trimethylamine methyltransferase
MNCTRILLAMTKVGDRIRADTDWKANEITRMQDLKQLYQAVLEGNAKLAKLSTETALAEGVDPQKLVSEFMIPAMDEAGRRYEAGEFFVPELLVAARAMKASLELIRPLLAAQGAQPAGRVVIGTVKGDLHDIGKNLVAAMLEGSGFEVSDLGVDVGPEKFVAAVHEKKATIVALSALLTTTMPSMRATVDALKAAGVRTQVKIMIGGAPVTQKYADEIGADGYSDSAASAVTLARRLMAA